MAAASSVSPSAANHTSSSEEPAGAHGSASSPDGRGEGSLPSASETVSSARVTVPSREGEAPPGVLESSPSYVVPHGPSLPETCHILCSAQGPNVYLVGTAHFSRESQEDVATVIREVKPNVVILELCNSRTSVLTLNEATLLREAKNMSMAKIRSLVETNGVASGLMHAVLLTLSASITEKLGMAPGGEFRRAYQEAQRIPDCYLCLGDRPIAVTLKRALHSRSFWKNLKLAWDVLTMGTADITSEELERLKKKDLLEEVLGQITGDYPQLSRVFVAERDLYMVHFLRGIANAAHISDTQLKKTKRGSSSSYTGPDTRKPVVVAVVGMGHVPGMIKSWRDPVDVESLTEIPSASPVWGYLRWSVKAVGVSLVAWVAYRSAKKVIQLVGTKSV